MLKYWKKKVKRDFLSWYEEKGKHHVNHKAVLATGKEAVQRLEGCSWWDWDLGSSVFFWCWPDLKKTDPEKGIPLCLQIIHKRQKYPNHHMMMPQSAKN